jgi:hypothetical protein
VIKEVIRIEQENYIVYAQYDKRGRITAVNSSAFVGADWGMEIDRGYGDKYHHAQGNYFSRAIYTEDGIPRYKLEDGKAVERTEEEIEADRAAIAEPGPRAEDVTLDVLAEHEARLCMLELTTTI